MKYKKLLFLIILFLCFNVNAIELPACTTEKMNNLKATADKIYFRYTYTMKNSVPEFTIHASNLNKDLKALIIQDFYSMNYREFKNDGKGNGSLSGFYEGQNVTITIKAYTPDQCSTRTISTKQIKLPYYNHYYDETFCKENPNFIYCSEFIDINLTGEQYEKELEKYNKSKEVEPIVVEEESNNKMILMIGIAVGVVLIITITTIYIIKRRKKNSL